MDENKKKIKRESDTKIQRKIIRKQKDKEKKR